MKILKFIGKCFCFFLIFVFLLIIIQENLRDKWAEGEYNTSVKVKGFYAEKENTLDVIFVGSSQMYADMAPAVLFDHFGITSYDFCANEQPLWVSYYYIKEALKHQKPKVIVLDVFTVYGDDYEEEGVMHINLDDLPLNANKINAIRNGVPKDLRYSYYFPIAKYHNTWTDLYQGKMEYSFYHQTDINKGYSPFIFKGEYEETAKEEVCKQTQLQELPGRAKEWLYKIIDLCKEADVPLLLTKTPNGNAERQMLYNSVSKIAEETNTPFFNMNVLLDGQAHINVLQAEKVSDLMGNYLCEHYSFEDKRDNPEYEEWKTSVQQFNRNKLKCMVVSAEDYETYLPLLMSDGYVVFITYKNEYRNGLPDDKLQFFNQTLSLNCNLDNNSYYFAILDSGNKVLESFDNNNTISQTEKGLNSDITLSYQEHNPLHININSSGELVDGESSIIINGTDFSVNCDGINLLIYDKYLDEMIEMVAFDQNNDMAMLRK